MDRYSPVFDKTLTGFKHTGVLCALVIFYIQINVKDIQRNTIVMTNVPYKN